MGKKKSSYMSVPKMNKAYSKNLHKGFLNLDSYYDGLRQGRAEKKAAIIKTKIGNKLGNAAEE